MNPNNILQFTTETFKDGSPIVLLPLEPGRRVHCILHGGRDGTITAVHGTPQPENVRTIGNGFMVTGGQAHIDVLWDDDTESRMIPEAIVYGVQWRIAPHMQPASEWQPRLTATKARQETEEQRREIARRVRKERIQQGREILAKLAPGVEYFIVANLQRDDSDTMTDYFATSTVQTHILATSKHGKDLFAEMRKAAARFEHTKHLGPGCDEYTPRIVASQDYIDSSGYYVHKNSTSRWHSEVQDHDYAHGWPTFSTQAQAQAWIDSRPAHQLTIQTYDAQRNEISIHHEWNIHHSSIENRQKWSMGRGYFLSAGSSYSGWQVRKTTISDELLEAIALGNHSLGEIKITPQQTAIVRPEWDKMKEFLGLPPDTDTAPEPTPAEETPTPSEPTSTAPVQIVHNADKNGIELHFAAKPPAYLLESLKKLGWRWSRAASCWYAKHSETAVKFAENIASTYSPA